MSITSVDSDQSPPVRVVGFIFSRHLDHVVLIEKKRPNWQAGHLNGVGGHVRTLRHETPRLAMSREAEEESALKIHPEDWLEVAIFPKWNLHVFAGRHRNLRSVLTMTDEEVYVVGLERVLAGHVELVEHTQWMVAMSIEALRASAGGWRRLSVEV